MPSKIKQFIAGYIPVIHRGYLNFFDQYSDINSVLVFGPDILKRVDYLRKDLRALAVEEQVIILKSLGRFKSVKVLTSTVLKKFDRSDYQLIMPDEDISREIAKDLYAAQIELVPVFLRWDRRSIEGVDQYPRREAIAASEVQTIFMKQAVKVSDQSSDIWRRVGAVLVDSTNRLIGSKANLGEPTPHSPWMEGDPRNIFKRGAAIEMSVFIHAEAALIAEAARSGTKLEGAKLYVSTFPCPACAKLIAHSGIKECFYKDGYAVLDGLRVLNDYGVTVKRIQVDDVVEDKNSAVWVPYPAA